MEVFKAIYPIPTPWAQNGTYPPRQGNDIQILIDGQTAYGEITTAFKKAKKFIYLAISYGETDFLLIPESEETLFGILMSRSNEGVDVRMVVWQPADPTTPDTIPDPAPKKISGVNEGHGSIQARWDKAKGYQCWYHSPYGHFEPVPMDFPEKLGCHHQKTYIMDDGDGGFVAFVAASTRFSDTGTLQSTIPWMFDALSRNIQIRLNGLRRSHRSMTFFTRLKDPRWATSWPISLNVIMGPASPMPM